MIHSVVSRALIGLFLVTFLLAAHYTWMAPASAPLIQGKLNKIQIAHGHMFPASEEAIAATQVRAFAISPSGKRTELKAMSAGKVVSLDYTPGEAGTHALGFVQDRGVSSRTPSGLKKGGKDVNPNATQAFRTVRTAVGYASTGKVTPAGKGLGLEFEIVPQIAGGTITLQLLRAGKPLPGAGIGLLVNGAEEPNELGKTDAQGRLVYKPGAGIKPPVLFIADKSEPAQKGAAFDSTNLSTSLYLGW